MAGQGQGQVVRKAWEMACGFPSLILRLLSPQRPPASIHSSPPSAKPLKEINLSVDRTAALITQPAWCLRSAWHSLRWGSHQGGVPGPGCREEREVTSQDPAGASASWHQEPRPQARWRLHLYPSSLGDNLLQLPPAVAGGLF